jgi:anti-sigma28 factor (negative regulator of flagellin synthesis)
LDLPMSELRPGRRVGARRSAWPRRDGSVRATGFEPDRRRPAELPHEDGVAEPYRPELVARLERAVREGCYRPDARAIADAIVRRLDSLA